MRNPARATTIAALALAPMLIGCPDRSPPAQPRVEAGRPAATSRAPDRIGAPGWMRTAALRGAVRADGKPLPGARVHLELLLGPRTLDLGRAVSDQQGELRLEKLPPGAARLTIAAPGRASHQLTLWIEAGSNRAPTLDLRRSAPLSGRVIDDRGRPVANASVRATPSGGRWSVSARSDQKGAFVIDGLSPGPHVLRAAAAEHVASVEPEVVAPASEIQLRLVRFYEIRGRLEGGGGRAATIRLAGSGIWPSRQLPGQADGSFRFERVPAGIYELAAHVEGPPPAASEILTGISVGPESPAPVTLRLLPVNRVVGLVQAEGKPVRGATLTLGQGGLSVLQNRVSTDGQGRFAFPPVAGADLRLSAWARGFLPVVEQKIQPAAEPLIINLNRGRSLRGSLVDSAGNPVSGALVWVAYRGGERGSSATAGGQLGVTTGPVPPIPAAGSPVPLAPPGGPSELGPTPSTTLSDGSGGFTLLGLPEGELRVLADHADYARASSPWIQLAEAEPEPVRLTMIGGAQLRGRILDERGRPLAGAQVIARGGTSDPRFTDTDQNGDFRLSGLARRVTLGASRSGYLPASRQLRLEEGQTYEVDLVLEPARGELRGRVLDPAGLPLAGARVAVRNQAGHRLVTTTTGASGGFELQGIGTRAVIVEASHQSYLGAEQRAQPGTDLELRLGYPAVLAGRVLDRRSGAPLRRYQVQAEGEGIRREASVRTADGRFRLEGLRPGRITLRISATGHATAVQQHQLPGPRSSVSRPEWVEVTLEPAGTLEGQLTDGSGTPLAGATLVVGGVRAETNVEGSFRLERVPEGNQVVEVRTRDGRRLRADPVVVRGGESRSGLRLMAR